MGGKAFIGKLIKTFFLLAFVSKINDLSAKVYNQTSGNKITILSEVHQANNLRFNLFDFAKDHIHIVSYYWDNSDLSLEFIEALRKAVNRGVEVRVITNCHVTMLRDFFNKVKRSIKEPFDNGSEIDFSCFNPQNSNNVLTNNLHEKMIIIDGEKTVFGSRNFSDDSLEQRDLDFLVEGPVVNSFQDHFIEVYNFVKKHNFQKCMKKASDVGGINFNGTREKLATERCEKDNSQKNFFIGNKYFPENKYFENGVKARLITNDVVPVQDMHGFDKNERLEYFILSDDILNRIMSTPFKHLRFYTIQFLLTPVFKNFLIESLYKNKSIEIITNSITSSAYYSIAGYYLSHYDLTDFTSKNAQIYLWKDSGKYKYVHNKAMIIDDRKVFIGSHNLNFASSVAASEIMLEVDSIVFSEELTGIFEADKKNHTFRATKSFFENEKELEISSFKMSFFDLFKNFIIELF